MLKKVPMLALGGDPSFRIQATVDPAFLEWGLRFLRHCTSARFSRNTGPASRLPSNPASRCTL